MAITYVNTGSSPNAGNGDNLRSAFTKVNSNFQFLSTQTISTSSEYYNVIPKVANTYTLGNAVKNWESLYVKNKIFINNKILEVSTAGYITFDGVSIGNIPSGTTPPLNPTPGLLWFNSLNGSLYIYYDSYWVDISTGGGGGGGANLLAVDSDILPTVNDTFNIGSNSKRFQSLFVNDDIRINGQTLSITSTGSIFVNGLLYTGPQGPQGPSGPVGPLGGIVYTVTASNTASYLINGQPDPSLTLLRGLTYYFNVATTGSNFQIKTAPTFGTSDLYNTGTTNNGTSSGVIIFTVPLNAPDNLYYISQQYINQQGTFNVVTTGDQGPSGPSGPSGPGADQNLDTTSSVTFSSLTVTNTATFLGPVLFNNTVTYMYSTNTVFTDNVIELHKPPAFMGETWVSEDFLDIGLKMHYLGFVAGTGATYAITNVGASSYQVDGNGPNPAIQLTRGLTYTINVNAPGHPFYIKTNPSTGTGDQYTNGVINNGTDTGTIIFTVPVSAPTNLYYACEFHASMQGVFIITGSGTTGTTAGLVINNASKKLEYIGIGYDVSPLYGTFKTGKLELANSIQPLVFPDNSTQSTAFTGTATSAFSAQTSTFAASAGSAVNVTGGTVTGTVPTGNQNPLQVGYLVVPQISTNTDYTLTINDQGKHIYSTTASGIQNVVIPDNATVPFPVGTAITVVLNGNGSISISTSAGVTLYFAGTDEVGNRTLLSRGMASLLKVETDTWFINGTGVN